MKANLKKLLEQSTEEELRLLVQSLYGENEQVDSRIEAALLANDSSVLAQHLKSQIQSLNRGSRFISYGESFQFSRTLDQLIGQIGVLVPDDPKAAFELADLFMNTHKKVYERCDDSGGSVGESYREALQLWLTAASAWQASSQPCQLDWTVEIRNRYDDNDYAVWDYLISSSLAVLGDKQLRDFGIQFESEVKQLSVVKEEGYNANLVHAELGVRAVAQALGDVAMFERSYLISRAEPNELQKETIANFCLEQKDAVSALKWLTGEWQPRFADRQYKLLDMAYVMMGRSDDLLQMRREAYNTKPSFERLQALLDAAPEAEREALQSDAVNQASSSDDIIVAVDTLMKLQDIDAAAAYVVQYPEKLQEVSHYSLAEWAVSLEQSGSSCLAAILIYRILLLEILQAGRTKVYRHAAKYYKALQRLDRKVVGYQSLVGKAEFDEELQALHGRKRSFWSLVT